MPLNNYQNFFDKSGFKRRNGQRAEDKFEESIKLFFESFVRKTNAEEDMFDHVDYDCHIKFKVDVKSVKETDTIWIELKNVNGHKGWLYGNCSHFAFERENYYILVKRKELADLVKRLTKKEMVTNKKDCLYKLYSRTQYGRQDLLTKIKPIDLKSIQHLYISKK